MNPLLHYVDFGGRERRSPNQLFDSNYYLEKYPDVAAAGVNPLHHYCDAGWTENRSPHPLFDGAFYLRRYPEVAKAKLNPLLHYLRGGSRNGGAPMRGLIHGGIWRDIPTWRRRGWMRWNIICCAGRSRDETRGRSFARIISEGAPVAAGGGD